MGEKERVESCFIWRTISLERGSGYVCKCSGSVVYTRIGVLSGKSFADNLSV